METIEASVVRFTYKSKESEWRVAVLRPKEPIDLFGEATFIATGNIPDVDSDEILALDGTWKEDKKYGHQFVISDCARVMPVTAKGLEKYLAAEIAGVGPILAKKIVAYFGADVKDVLDNDPMRLQEMGMDIVLIRRIIDSWTGEKHLQQIQMFLAEHDIKSKTWARRIYKQFGADSVGLLQDNPYRLTQLKGIGFRKADEMAVKLGWPETSPERTEAACKHVLEEAKNDGHVFLHKNQILEQVAIVAGRSVSTNEDSDNPTFTDHPLSLAEVEIALKAVILRGEIIEETLEIDGVPFIAEYLPGLYYSETHLAKQINYLLQAPARPSIGLAKLIADAEKFFQMKLSDKQQKAVIAALLNAVSVMTGGPGTGKTSCSKVILYCMQKLNWTVSIAAPTGRAAKRISEVTDHPASTVHRLLGFENGQWVHNRANPLECQALLLDEWSMGDTDLTYRVMEAVAQGCHVVFIGDIDQLPSVGPGMVLRDLIDSGCVLVTRLDTIFRQAQGSLIVQNAHRIIKGEYPRFPDRGDTDADNFIMYVPQVEGQDDKKGKKVDDVDWIYDKLNYLAEYIPQRYGINALSGIQVLAPIKKGTCGTHKLNEVLHQALNPDGEQFHIKGHIYHVGDRVMQTKNDYTLKVFNGDMGVIDSYDKELEIVRIMFDREMVSYPYEDIGNIQLAFASTVHKVQGSEIDVVIIVLLGQHYTMLERNLVYTALTRAKRMCLFLTTRKALSMAVTRNQIQKRNSLLGERIKLGRKMPRAVPGSIPLSAPSVYQLSA